MERIVEELEGQCYSNMQKMIKTVDGLGIEYDEDVVCDVCRSVRTRPLRPRVLFLTFGWLKIIYCLFSQSLMKLES